MGGERGNMEHDHGRSNSALCTVLDGGSGSIIEFPAVHPGVLPGKNPDDHISMGFARGWNEGAVRRTDH